MKKRKRLAIMLPAAVIVNMLVAVKLVLFIPMAVAAIFPAIAYLHILVLMTFFLGCVSVFLFFSGAVAAGCVDLQRESTEEVSKEADDSVPAQAAWAGIIMICFACFAYFFTNSFLLYITGDWSSKPGGL